MQVQRHDRQLQSRLHCWWCYSKHNESVSGEHLWWYVIIRWYWYNVLNLFIQVFYTLGLLKMKMPSALVWFFLLVMIISWNHLKFAMLFCRLTEILPFSYKHFENRKWNKMIDILTHQIILPYISDILIDTLFWE